MSCQDRDAPHRGRRPAAAARSTHANDDHTAGDRDGAPGRRDDRRPAHRSRQALRHGQRAVTAVDGIDLVVRPGEIVAFLGPNGAGKTTTIDMMLGFTRPDAGSVEILDGSPADAIRAGRIAAVLQTGGLLKDLTVAETVRLTASLFPSARPPVRCSSAPGSPTSPTAGSARARAASSSGCASPSPCCPTPTCSCSTSRPPAWTSRAGATSGRRSGRTPRRGRTVLFATHYLEEADAYADRIVLVRHGRIVADGTPRRSRASPSGRTVRATLPDADQVALLGLPGVESVEVRGDAVLLRTTDSDATARHLLTETAARDLEITAHSLEDAFVALTTDATTGSPR